MDGSDSPRAAEQQAVVPPDQSAIEHQAAATEDGEKAAAAVAAAAEDQPAAAEEQAAAEGEEDKVRAVSRQLSRLSIPGGDEDDAADSAPGSASGVASLAGLDELPEQLSPSKPNFQPTCEPSPELYERLAGGLGDADAPVSPPENFYPRSKSVSPVQRKIKEMEVGAELAFLGGGDGERCG